MYISRAKRNNEVVDEIDPMKSERKELKGTCWVNTNNMGNSLLPKQCYLSRYSYRANFWNNGLLKKGNRASPLLVCFKYMHLTLFVRAQPQIRPHGELPNATMCMEPVASSTAKLTVIKA